MGIFKALTSAIGGVMKDQWKEMFYCNAIPGKLLLVRGHKMVSENSANNGNDNVITDGSIICVADGEAALVVCNGKVTSVFSEPGEHIFHSDRTVGIFSGKDAATTVNTVASDIGTRFSFGGDAPIMFRVYYMNTKEIMGLPVSISALPVRITDTNTGLDMDATVSISGSYSIKIVNPYIIYSNIIGNVEEQYTTDTVAGQLSAEVASHISKAVADLTLNGIRVSGTAALPQAIAQAVKESINPWLRENRGIEVFSLPISGIHVSDADKQTVNGLQYNKVLTDPTMAGAALVSAQADAMRAAASNTGRKE